MSTPAHWPASVEFAASPRYHHSVPASVRAMLVAGGASSRRGPCRRASALVRIKPITDPGHPACGQHGLFAFKKIPPRTHIIDYVGEVHCEERPGSDYDLSLYRAEGVAVGIDARAVGNEARFVNDYRGVAARPNAEFVERRAASGELRVGVSSAGGTIRRGDEILVSYGKAWWRCRA